MSASTPVKTVFSSSKVFLTTAIQRKWFPASTGIIKELIDLIASYFCRIDVFGIGEGGFVLDGTYDIAQFNTPNDVCLSLDGTTLICADGGTHRIRLIRLIDGLVSTLAGSGLVGFTHGDAQTAAAFFSPQSICADPSRPGSYFIGDISSVRYYNGSDKTVSLIAGSNAAETFVDTDGAGTAARFNSVGGLLCTSDGQTLL